MRTFGKVLTVLFVITYVVALAEFFVYPAMAKGEKRSGNAPGTMPAGYMNAALHRAQNMGQEGKAVAKGKENAKWSENPRDPRGQGNMGKPEMRDPYGFDKDSGRIGSERGRRIEATLDLAGITNTEFTTTEPFIDSLYASYEYYMEQAETNPGHPFAYALAQQYAAIIERYTTDGYAYMTVGWIPPHWDPSSIDYTLTFTPPEGFEGTTLEVTTIVTSINDYDGVSGLHYDAGQVLVEETQEIALGTDNTLDYSYAPSVDLIGGMVIGSVSLFAELSIIITDPESGLSHTIVFDNQLYVYRLGGSLPTKW